MFSILKRESCPQVEINENKSQLADACKKELGYNELQNVLNREKQKSELAKCLDRIGLRPFDIKTVNEYKAKEAMRGWWKEVGSEAKIAMALGAIVVSIIITSCLLFANGQIILPSILTGLCILLTGILVFGALPNILLDRKAIWKTALFSNYNAPVPEYVLQTALDLNEETKKANVDCRFEIEYLFVQKVVDPFLVVCAGGERYYLEVWDEPNFGAKRTV